MGEDMQSFVSEVRERSENSELDRQEARMKDALIADGIDVSMTGNDSMDLFTINLKQIVGTQQSTVEISGPVHFIPSITDFIIALSEGNSDATISPDAITGFGLDPDNFIPNYERDIRAAVKAVK